MWRPRGRVCWQDDDGHQGVWGGHLVGDVVRLDKIGDGVIVTLADQGDIAVTHDADENTR